MNQMMNQLSLLNTNRIFCLALGLGLAFICQQSYGQSAVTPPPVSPITRYQAELDKLKLKKENFISQIAAIEVNEKTYENELEKIKKRGAKLSLSADSYPEILKTIHSQRVQLSIDLAGLDARHVAIDTAIAKAIAERQEKVLKPYKRLVEVRESKFEQVESLMAKGSAGSDKMREAEVELIEARLRLAEASKPSGSLSYLNSQLLDSSLEIAEKTARLEKANSLFKDVEEYRSFKETLSETKRKLQAAVSNKQAILRDQSGIETKISRQEQLILAMLKNYEERVRRNDKLN